jgi:hypothetical protein
MKSLLPRRFRALAFSAVLVLVSILAPGTSALATAAESPAPSPTASPLHTTLPPYESPGEPLPRPVRTRQDRLISTIAPIAMVVVLFAGLYIYWLIRKGL